MIVGWLCGECKRLTGFFVFSFRPSAATAAFTGCLCDLLLKKPSGIGMIKLSFIDDNRSVYDIVF